MRTKYLKGLRVGEPAAACRREKDVKIWILLLSGTCLLLHPPVAPPDRAPKCQDRGRREKIFHLSQFCFSELSPNPLQRSLIRVPQSSTFIQPTTLNHGQEGRN